MSESVITLKSSIYNVDVFEILMSNGDKAEIVDYGGDFLSGCISTIECHTCTLKNGKKCYDCIHTKVYYQKYLKRIIKNN